MNDDGEGDRHWYYGLILAGSRIAKIPLNFDLVDLSTYLSE